MWSRRHDGYPRKAGGTPLSFAAIVVTLLMSATVLGVTTTIKPASALVSSDSLGCADYSFSGSSQSLQDYQVADCALEAANLLAHYTHVETTPDVVTTFMAIALAETDYQGSVWYPGCIQSPSGAGCVWTYQGGAEASGVLQEGSAGHPSRAYQTGSFTNSTASAMCPGFNKNNWESVWFNPLCSFEWAFAYYQSHDGSFGFWAAYKNGHYFSEYNNLKTGICYNFCKFDGLSEMVTAGEDGNYWVALNPLLSVNCSPYYGGADSCVYKLYDSNTGYMGMSLSCEPNNAHHFSNVNAQSWDTLQGTVWIYLDSGCNVLLTGIDNAFVDAPVAHHGYSSNTCYVDTDGQCGRFDDCNDPAWDSYFANGDQASDCNSWGW